MRFAFDRIESSLKRMRPRPHHRTGAADGAGHAAIPARPARLAGSKPGRKWGQRSWQGPPNSIKLPLFAPSHCPGRA